MKPIEKVTSMALIIVLKNVSNLAPVSDYKYQVLIGDGGPMSNIIETGKVIGHDRSKGWEELVKAFMEERVKD